tara:strand:+ start:1439 stop:2005 length:567 start_codon:yes stop_codon:yes gene_type:complete
MQSELNIYQRINKIMAEVDYVKRGSAGQGTGVLYDEVISLLRPELIKHGVMMRVSFIADSSRKNAKDSYIYEGFFSVRYQNIDDKDDYFEDHVVSHAMDAGDKAPGKAITYATKISMLKVFSIETGLNDESRAEERATLTDDQIKTIDSLIKEKGIDKNKFLAAYAIKQVGDLPAKLYPRAMAQLESK